MTHRSAPGAHNGVGGETGSTSISQMGLGAALRRAGLLAGAGLALTAPRRARLGSSRYVLAGT